VSSSDRKTTMILPFTWVRASYCTSSGCVEVAPIGDSIGIRDSKDVGLGQQTYDAQSWRDFTASVKNGRYDF
jgi:hypothetical protein